MSVHECKHCGLSFEVDEMIVKSDDFDKLMALLDSDEPIDNEWRYCIGCAIDMSEDQNEIQTRT